MAGPGPGPLVLFSLCPYNGNKRAEGLVSHPNNDHNVSKLSDGTPVLDVGFHLRGKSSETLAMLGRGADVDIYVEASCISRHQCSFKIDIDTGNVMLYDRSFANSTQVFGENSTPFERERDERKVLVQKGLNTVIGMGGERRDLIQFRLQWHQDATQTAETIRNYDTLPYGRLENPRLARTVDEAPTDLQSRRETRVHTPGHRRLKMRYVKVAGGRLGSGKFGTVHKAIDVDSGRFMAVKILERPTRASKQEYGRRSWDEALKREVETLSKISHVSKSSSTCCTHELISVLATYR